MMNYPEHTREETPEEKRERLANARRKRQYDVINRLRREYYCGEGCVKDIPSRELANPVLGATKIVFIPIPTKKSVAEIISDEGQ